MRESFRRFAQGVSTATGHPTVFVLAVALIVVWIVSGPIFRFSDTWQLVINTGTTIITFLMVFILQNTQNRDNTAVQLKLDELIRAVHNARSRFIDLEDLPDEELERITEEFARLSERAQSEKTERHRRRGTSGSKRTKKRAG